MGHQLLPADTLYEIRYNPQSAWSGQGLHLFSPKGERRMHPRDCVLAE
jgi:hypothetical protein